MVIIVLCLVVMGMLLSPLVKSDKTVEKTQVISSANKVMQFSSGDHLGLTRVEEITLSTTSSNYTEVYIMTKERYDRGQILAIYNPQTNLTSGNDIVAEIPEFNKYVECVIYFEPEDGVSMEVTYRESVVISPLFYTFIPILAVIFIVASAAWIGYLTPKKKKYAVTSIYG